MNKEIQKAFEDHIYAEHADLEFNFKLCKNGKAYIYPQTQDFYWTFMAGRKSAEAENKKLREGIEFVIFTQQRLYGNATELHLVMSDLVIELKQLVKGGE